jgi:hypothetical protein
MRIYDSRIVKFLSVDPITAKYPELTPYQFASNRPIDGVDLDGLEHFAPPLIMDGSHINVKATAALNKINVEAGAEIVHDAKDMVKGLWQLIRHPQETMDGFFRKLDYYETHPIQALDKLVTTYSKIEKEVKNPSPKTMGKVIFNGALIATGGLVGELGEAANAAKITEGFVPPSVEEFENSIRTLQETSINQSENVPYYRVQGGNEKPFISKQLISVDESGNVSFKNSTLNVSTGNLDHVNHFLNLRPGAYVVKFEVPSWFDDMIKEYAIPQSNYTTNPLNQGGIAPKLVDPTTPGLSYELPQIWSKWLNENAIRGSGKIIKKGG